MVKMIKGGDKANDILLKQFHKNVRTKIPWCKKKQKG